MPVQSRKNQFLGINPHLHSFWQGAGKWNRFHNVHVGDIYKTLNEQLRPMGYKAEVEESLQIRRVDDIPPLDEIEVERDWEHPYSAISIARHNTRIGWIELLSPSNKGLTADGAEYRRRRHELLEVRFVFIEVDYLHEIGSTFYHLPDYTTHTPHSHPYKIIVFDPSPSLDTGTVCLYEYDVDEALPKIKIPLRGSEFLEFDFAIAYSKTFEEGLYGFEMDYSQLPMNFERYSEADQTRITRRMLAVLEASRDGVDLESAPFPLKEVTLQEALAQIEVLNQ